MYWDKYKDDDYEIKMIVAFTKKLKNKRLCTYKVVWDTGHVEENVKRHCLLNDAKNLYDNFCKNQKQIVIDLKKILETFIILSKMCVLLFLKNTKLANF